MRLLHLSLVAVLLVGCGDAGLALSSSPTEPDLGVAETDVGTPIADLRADTNRDGVISFTDASDDTGEDVWDAEHGAVFLANIDDDQESCPTNVADIDLPSCNDAADDHVNGPLDALDLARMKTKPWGGATPDATATLTFTAANQVRIFKVDGTRFTPLPSFAELSLDEIKSGIELAIEGKDIVRDRSVWDGFVDVTFTVRAQNRTATDKVRLRISPVMTYHHLLRAEQTWVAKHTSTQNSALNLGNAATRADLAAAAAAAGVDPPNEIPTNDSWAQDFFEPGFMSMPAPNGKQHVIRVNFRSANERGNDFQNPLRQAGRFVFDLRGKDVAAIQEFDPQRGGEDDTLNSFGNLETIPPYTNRGESFPLGRVIRGSIPSFAPDRSFTRMMEAQQVQPPLYVDTSWLLVGHIDETLSFVKASSPRGWVLLINDATLARDMLITQSNAGHGDVPLHVGKYWTSGATATSTIDQVLADTDIMAASAEAVVEVNAQLARIKAETSLANDEIVSIPFLHMKIDGYSIAYQPGMVNGIYIADDHFVAPSPHGPVIGGEDIFEVSMRSALAPYGVNVHFAEDWDTYHRNDGEVHCGTNSTRAIPETKWWESGR